MSNQLNERKLDTIQTKEKLNTICANDEIGPGGANHFYTITRNDTEEVVGIIEFQKGPRKEKDSIHGVIDSDLLEIVRDRMISFQNGPFACEYNKIALYHIEEALKALNARIEDRVKRDVFGKNEK